MNLNDGLPEDILDAARFIKEAGEQKYLTRTDKDNLNRARLRIAFWVLRQENIAASRENLCYILGTDAAEIMGAYDKYLNRDGDDAEKTRDGGKKSARKTGFWENA